MVALISIKASKEDPTSLCFNDISFHIRKYLVVYSNLLMTFAKVAYSFKKCCLTRLSPVKWILIYVDTEKIDWMV